VLISTFEHVVNILFFVTIISRSVKINN